MAREAGRRDVRLIQGTVMAAPEHQLTCRVCGGDASFLGSYSPYSDFEVPVFECARCGSRLAPHDPEIHERMHQASSTYDFHDVLTEACREHFERGDESALRARLARTRKFAYLIDAVEGFAKEPARILEIGSSSGALASWFILKGHRYLGIDISEAVVERAQAAFGEGHFKPLSAWNPASEEPFDVIMHAGTIGCVANPMEMTSEFLDALRPGGLLVFNAPNRDACYRPGQLWVDRTHPPDLVTLFRPGVWKERFGFRSGSEHGDRLSSWVARGGGLPRAARDETLELETRAASPWRGSPRTRGTEGRRAGAFSRTGAPDRA